MAEPLTIVGGIASFAQIIGLLIKPTEVAAKFCQTVHDAPAEIKRINEKLICLKGSLGAFQGQLVEIDGDEDIIPRDMRSTLHHVIESVYNDILTISDKCGIASYSSSTSLRYRFKWVLLDQHLVHSMMIRLRDSEDKLTFMIHLLSM
ncbi:hypothetical protein N7478_008742 [Penicillium angulare]|uniref:uncharacterized protein n=1 Tax=Penicillium angulare TaxID=116970 RepID=UPI002541A542|nr:uncharacterized protein N7478_008742 [Penicillium angulare]KAJ5273617.1 hypothetical protein N7478_008742 [Penicillium angulare]